MLNIDVRKTIFELHRQEHGLRKIARTLNISRKAVKNVLVQGTVEPPCIERNTELDTHIDEIRELYTTCRANMVRVWEELEAQGTKVGYSTLTGFCRRNGIGVKPKLPAGKYLFDPGQEFQHDTSPHVVLIGEKLRKMQCAGLVLGYSTMRYAQLYPTFNRFYCKIFLTEGIVYFGGAAERCMVDNTSVIIAYGTGKQAVPAPEMKAFADRFGSRFVAHEKGDANRSAHVERFFHHIENNFYPGRTFKDLEDLNNQLIQWCDKINRTFKKNIQAKPIELFKAEQPCLKPLPIYVPEVYSLHPRIVNIEGYVTLNTNRYSAPAELIGRRVEVRESKDRVRISHGHKIQCEHKRMEEKSYGRVTLPEHRRRGLWRDKRKGQLPALPEEAVLKNAGAPFEDLIGKLKTHTNKRHAASIRKLYRMFLDYPTPDLRKTVEQALAYGLTDLDRIERMLLKTIANEFFRLPDIEDDHEEERNG